MSLWWQRHPVTSTTSLSTATTFELWTSQWKIHSVYENWDGAGFGVSKSCFLPLSGCLTGWTSPQMINTCGWFPSRPVLITHSLYGSASHRRSLDSEYGTTTNRLKTLTEGWESNLGSVFLEWVFSVQQVCSLVFFSTHTSCAVCFLQLKVVHVFLDGLCISPLGGFLIRKGAGNCHFDFAQEILFIDYLQSNTSTAAHNRTLTTTSKNTEDTHAHWYSTLSILLHSSLCNNLNSTYFLSSWGMKLFVCVFRGRNRRDELASMDYEAPLMPCGCILAFAYWWYSL